MSVESEKNTTDKEITSESLVSDFTSGRVCWKCGETYDESLEICPVDGVSLVSIGDSTKKDPNVGSLFDGRYLITRKLGEGGMGIVYAARQIDFDRHVAIKILKMSYVSNRDVRRRFMYEARTISNLKHPNAVRLYDFGQSPSGNVYMVMELLQGESLADRLSNEFVSYRQIFNMLIPICGVLAEAHHNGVIHRDLKPENIYIGQIEGQPEFYKLLDFGIAKHLKSNLLTQSGILWGTPAYMSPEQILGQTVSSATDIYAIGVMLYELISGRLPFNAETPVALAMKHLAAPVRPLQSIPGLQDVPTPLDDLILSALNKEPDKRPKSMEIFVELLASIHSEYFDDELLDTVPPHLIDVNKYDEWIQNEPTVGHPPVEGNDIYALSRAIAGFEYAQETGERDVGDILSDKIRIPVAHEQPSMVDIARQDNKTNMAWLSRNVLNSDSDAVLQEQTDVDGIHSRTSGNDSNNKVPNDTDTKVTLDPTANANRDGDAYPTFVAASSSVSKEIPLIQKISKQTKKFKIRRASGEKQKVSYKDADPKNLRDRVIGGGAVPSLASTDKNYASWSEAISAKSRISQFMRDRKTRIAFYSTAVITCGLLVAFWVIQLSNERTRFNQNEEQQGVEVPVVSPSTVGGNPVNMPNDAPQDDSAFKPSTSREIAIRFAVVTALSTVQTAENMTQSISDNRDEDDGDDKNNNRRRRPRKRTKLKDKERARKLLQGTF